MQVASRSYNNLNSTCNFNYPLPCNLKQVLGIRMWISLRGTLFCLRLGSYILLVFTLQGKGRAGTWAPGAAIPALAIRTCHGQSCVLCVVWSSKVSNNACRLRAPKSWSSKQTIFLSFIPLIQFPTGYLFLNIPGHFYVLETNVIAVLLKGHLQNSPSSCRTTFLLKDSGAYLFSPFSLSPHFSPPFPGLLY